MAAEFKLEIVTPYRVFFSESAEMVIVDSCDGELGIMSGHLPIVTPIVIGIVKIKKDGQWRKAFLSDGFLELENNKVTILVGSADWPEEIDVARANSALSRAKERLDDTSMPWEKKRATLSLKRAQARLKLADEAKKNA